MSPRPRSCMRCTSDSSHMVTDRCADALSDLACFGFKVRHRIPQPTSVQRVSPPALRSWSNSAPSQTKTQTACNAWSIRHIGTVPKGNTHTHTSPPREAERPTPFHPHGDSASLNFLRRLRGKSPLKKFKLPSWRRLKLALSRSSKDTVGSASHHSRTLRPSEVRRHRTPELATCHSNKNKADCERNAI